MISFALFRNRTAIRTELGSYISPKESQIANSLELYFSLQSVMRELQTEKVEMPLVRLGSKGDGGYVLLEKDYSNSYLISGGISNDNNFEIALANLGAHGHQVDFSIHSPPNSHPNLTFSANRLVGENYKRLQYDISLDELFQTRVSNKYSDNLLKLDIEGSEWEILESSRVLDKFSQIFIELHYLERLGIPEYSKNSLDALENLLSKFFPVFISGNNCCGFITVGGYSLPRVMEISLLNRNFYSFIQNTNGNNINSRFQSKNYPARAPLVLKSW